MSSENGTDRGDSSFIKTVLVREGDQLIPHTVRGPFTILRDDEGRIVVGTNDEDVTVIDKGKI